DTPSQAQESQPFPEPHPLDYEWHFTNACAEKVAHLLAANSRSVVCLGAPTVARALSGLRVQAVLFDRSPSAFARAACPRPAVPRNQGITPVLGAIANLNRGLPAQVLFDAAFLDPPWYADVLESWLWYASRCVRTGGLIAFALYPELVRP